MFLNTLVVSGTAGTLGRRIISSLGRLLSPHEVLLLHPTVFINTLASSREQTLTVHISFGWWYVDSSVGFECGGVAS